MHETTTPTRTVQILLMTECVSSSAIDGLEESEARRLFLALARIAPVLRDLLETDDEDVDFDLTLDLPWQEARRIMGERSAEREGKRRAERECFALEEQAAAAEIAAIEERAAVNDPVDARELSCQGLTYVDASYSRPIFHPGPDGRYVIGYEEKMARLGEGHVYGCDLIGHGIGD